MPRIPDLKHSSGSILGCDRASIAPTMLVGLLEWETADAADTRTTVAISASIEPRSFKRRNRKMTVKPCCGH